MRHDSLLARWNPFGRPKLWNATRTLVGLILLVAGIGKIFLVIAPSSTSVLSAIFGYKVVWLTGSIEIALGIAILFFSSVPGLIGVVLAWFMLLSATNVVLGVMGAATCECLGTSGGLSPWTMLAIDLVIVSTLVTVSPSSVRRCLSEGVLWWKETIGLVAVYGLLLWGHMTTNGQLFLGYRNIARNFSAPSMVRGWFVNFTLCGCGVENSEQ